MMKQGQNETKKIACLGLLAALAIIFGYVEVLFPFHIGIPGIKLGIANIMTVLVLYLFGWREAGTVMLVRVVVIGLLFGNVYGILYSLSGGILSLIGMSFFRYRMIFGMVGVSILGGILHNMGQLFLAAFIVKELKLVFYGPILLIAGIVTGFLIGIVTELIFKRLEGSI